MNSRLTWLELKKQIEEQGIKDEDVIGVINYCVIPTDKNEVWSGKNKDGSIFIFSIHEDDLMPLNPYTLNPIKDGDFSISSVDGHYEFDEDKC